MVALGWGEDVDDTASLLVGIGRIAGLLGAYLVLVELVLLARLPALERLAGFERLTRLHRLNGFAAISLLRHARRARSRSATRSPTSCHCSTS